MTLRSVLHKIVENYPLLVLYVVVTVTLNLILLFTILWILA